MRVTHYHIASGTPERVCEQMRQYIKDGWQPLGGPVSHSGGDPKYGTYATIYQVVVKMEPAQNQPAWSLTGQASR